MRRTGLSLFSGRPARAAAMLAAGGLALVGVAAVGSSPAQAAVGDAEITLSATSPMTNTGTDYQLPVPVDGGRVDATFAMEVAVASPGYIDTLGWRVTFTQTSGTPIASALDLPVRVTFNFTNPDGAALTAAGITSATDIGHATWMTGTLGPEHFSGSPKPFTSTIGQLNDEFAILGTQTGAAALRGRLYEGATIDMVVSAENVPQGFGGTVSYQLYSQKDNQPITDVWTLNIQAPNTPSTKPVIALDTDAAVSFLGEQASGIGANVTDPVESADPGRLRVSLDGGAPMTLSNAKAAVSAIGTPGVHQLVYSYAAPRGETAVERSVRLWVQDRLAAPAGNLRIASYNVFGGNSATQPKGGPGWHVYDIEQQAAFLRSLDADIVGLQEVDWHYHANSNFQDVTADLADALDMYSCYWAGQSKAKLDPMMPGTDRNRGVGIISRYPITDCQGSLFSATYTRSDKNNSTLVWADIDVNGNPVRVFNTHLYAGGASSDVFRTGQMNDALAIIAAQADGTPQFFTGDMNAKPDNPTMAPALAALTDAWAESGNDPAAGFTIDAWNPTSRIDYVLADEATSDVAVRAVAAYVPTGYLAEMASDHRPIVADYDVDWPNPITSITPVADVHVAFGTDEASARAALPATTTITDAAGVSHTVALSWTVTGYAPRTAGSYPVTATFTLPTGVDQTDPATVLQVATNLVVDPRPAATVVATPSRVAAGQGTVVTVSGFDAGETISFSLEVGSTSVALGQVVAKADGTATLSVAIPAATASGIATLRATGAASGVQAETPVTITASQVGPTPTPPTTTTPTPTPTATGTGDTTLPITGGTAMTISGGVVLALLAGGVLLLARRRRTAH